MKKLLMFGLVLGVLVLTACGCSTNNIQNNEQYGGIGIGVAGTLLAGKVVKGAKNIYRKAKAKKAEKQDIIDLEDEDFEEVDSEDSEESEEE